MNNVSGYSPVENIMITGTDFDNRPKFSKYLLRAFRSTHLYDMRYNSYMMACSANHPQRNNTNQQTHFRWCIVHFRRNSYTFSLHRIQCSAEHFGFVYKCFRSLLNFLRLWWNLKNILLIPRDFVRTHECDHRRSTKVLFFSFL